ncbi:tetratricopeptide repeat protein [Mangrovicoccus algicola]|uniref:Tetratricopeptide repeat protein n=1 Tax=Mangrovicoccus algicola TaxID=2771008 RepID=A0A8J6YWF9_9RHOB|nr:tetratricopeptide repeat protein [Mangrovicoccus algicola]MBE3637504.1 tetratricopeptide repeat protein [Mangrovicoccus algicola]
MTRPSPLLKPVFLALACSVTSPAVADPDRLDELFAELQDPQAADWQGVEAQIWQEWSRSGSPAMDLLLQRGREAMEAGDLQAAVDHLTALTDHAPDFAEGWNARATAFYQEGELGLAVADIERALALNPRHFGALSGFGMILEELGHRQQALEVYGAALAIHPHQPPVEEAIERIKRELGEQEI